MIDVVPAIIASDFDDLTAQIGQVKNVVDFVQVDIMDGQFAPEKTWPYAGDNGEYAGLVGESEGLPYWKEVNVELDMMVVRPADSLEDWVHAGVRRFIIHIESDVDYPKLVTDIRAMSGGDDSFFYTEVGLALVPSTPNEKLYPFLEEADFVQFMGNDRIGYHGVELDEAVYDKIKDVRARYPELPIAVDIGVDEETAPKLVVAGATRLVSGSAIFDADKPKETISYFQSLERSQ